MKNKLIVFIFKQHSGTNLSVAENAQLFFPYQASLLKQIKKKLVQFFIHTHRINSECQDPSKESGPGTFF